MSRVPGLDYGFAVAVDVDGGAYLTGTTSSSDFPVTPGAYQATIKGGPNSSPNAFVTKVALASESKGLWLPAIAISPSAPTAQQGQSITLTAKVNGPAGDPIPTGAITFYVITYSDQVGYISYSQQVPLQSNGMATWTVSESAAGVLFRLCRLLRGLELSRVCPDYLGELHLLWAAGLRIGIDWNRGRLSTDGLPPASPPPSKTHSIIHCKAFRSASPEPASSFRRPLLLRMHPESQPLLQPP